MSTKSWYSKVRVPGTVNPIAVKTDCVTASDAKKIIKAQYGANAKIVVGPTAPSKPPGWFK